MKVNAEKCDKLEKSKNLENSNLSYFSIFLIFSLLNAKLKYEITDVLSHKNAFQ